MSNPLRLFRAYFMALGVSLTLAGCASPSFNIYTLMPLTAPSVLPTYTLPVEVTSVTIPPQLNQPYLIFRGKNGEILPRYSDRWSAPLDNEIRTALADGLIKELSVQNAYAQGAKNRIPDWRVEVQIQRFDAISNQAALVQAIWRARPYFPASEPDLRCLSQIRVPVLDSKTMSMIYAQQRAIAQLAHHIAVGMQNNFVECPLFN